MYIMPVNFKLQNTSFGAKKPDSEKNRLISGVKKTLSDNDGISTRFDKRGLLIPINPHQLSDKTLAKFSIDEIMSCMSPQAKKRPLITSETDIPPALSDIVSDDDYDNDYPSISM